MNPEYEYYGTYTADASGDINLEGQIRDFLWTMELMFDYVKKTEPEIFDDFSKKIDEKYTKELGNASFVLEDIGFDKIADDETLLGSYPHFKELGLKIIMKYIPLIKGHVLTEDLVSIRWLDYCRAKYILQYHQITTLVDILGRDEGIQFFKDFVDFWGEELSKNGKGKSTIEAVRENRVKAWSSGGAMEFGVTDVGPGFLAKFDRCVSHESMKHVDDPELAYYVVCYPGARLLDFVHENIRMRRTQTLFSADFCDEYRWDKNIDPNPEQPSLEFSRKMVQK
ncbi:MAG: L-2-amino-thiazoline-4-carboxylic acid hydrolase [Candidatus Thorarchaeota archaeon]